jgi:hypothetical protein
MRGRAFTGMALVAALGACAATMLVAPAGADEEQVIRVDVWGHPFEPYAQIPEEITAGSPGTWSQLQGNMPSRCQAIGTLYDTGGGGVTVDALAYELSDRNYANPTTSFAANPETRNTKSAAVSTFPNGPSTKAECATPTSGVAAATWGRYLSQNFSIEGSSSDSTNKATDGLVTTETTNKVFGLKIGPLSIDTVFSWLKVQYKPSGEPVVSYKIELAGISDGQKQSGLGGTGLALAGPGLAGGDVAKQFNSQVKGGQGAFKTLGKYGLRVLEPRIGYSRSQRYVFEISALDGILGFAARENQIGQGFGFRLGVSRSAGRYETAGKTAPHDKYDYMDDPTFGFY